MKELRVIGFTSDHGGLILAAKRGTSTESFLLALDDELLTNVARARQHAGVADSVPEAVTEGESVSGPSKAGSAGGHRSGRSSLTPREIQARLRAGQTVGEVAIEAGVGPDWIDRFAAPVLAEQEAVMARALGARLHTPRRGPSDRTLEASVQRNLADRGVSLSADELRSGWSVGYLLDSEWLVRFSFVSKNRPSIAEWVYDTSSGALSSRNRLATELGFVDPARQGSAPPALFDLEEDGDAAQAEDPSPVSRRPRAAQPADKPARAAAKKVAATARIAASGPPVVRRAVPPEGHTSAGGERGGPATGDQPGRAG